MSAFGAEFRARRVDLSRSSSTLSTQQHRGLNNNQNSVVGFILVQLQRDHKGILFAYDTAGKRSGAAV